MTSNIRKNKCPKEATTRIHRRKTFHQFTRDNRPIQEDNDDWMMQMGQQEEHHIEEGGEQ